MKKHISFVLGFLVLLSQPVLAGSAVQKDSVDCQTVAGQFGGPDWKYCVYRYADAGDDLMFYLHGSGGAETDWGDGPLENGVLAAWRAHHIAPPTVVSVSFGQVWLLAEKNASPASGLYDYFLGVVVPTLKQKILAGAAFDKTYLFGVSMGGFNGAQLYLKHPELFARVDLICPAMSTLSPFASDSDVQNYMNLIHADPQLMQDVIQLAQTFLPTEADWEKHSPTVLAAQPSKTTLPPLYVSNGEADPYGFTYSNKIFVELVKKQGVPVQSNFYPGGGHCDVDPEAAALGLIPN